MLAEGAHEVVGQGIALKDVSADLADVAFFARGFGLGLHVLVVIIIGHGLAVGDDSRLGDRADEHAVGIQIHVLLHLQRHEGIDIAGQEDESVVRAKGRAVGKLVHVASTAEAEGLKDRKGGVHRQAVNIHFPRLLDNMMGIIFLVDGDGDAVGGVCHLGYGVDDESVVLFAVVRGHYVQTVADVEKGGQIVLVGSFILLCQIFAAQLVRKGLELGAALLGEGGANLDGIFGEGDVFASLQHALHDLGGLGRPASVFHERNGSIAEVTLGQVVKEDAHEGEDVCVVGGGCQHQLAVAEGVLHRFCHVTAGQIVDHDLGTAAGFQLVCQLQNGLLGVAVDGGVGNDDAFLLRAIGRPGVVKIDIGAEILRKHGAVEGADGFDVKSRGLFQKRLHLSAVFSNDADVVASCLASPLFLHVKGAKLAEGVGGEEHLVGAVVGHNDLGPMHHGSGVEGEAVTTEGQRVAVGYHKAAVFVLVAEKVLHHDEGLGGCHNGGVRVVLEEVGHVCGVVGLHMLHDQIVGRTTRKSILQIVKPLVGEACVHGVNDGYLLVKNDVGVVRHSVGDGVLTLKQIDSVVVYADVLNILANHRRDPFLY